MTLPRVAFIADAIRHPNAGTEGQLAALICGLAEMGVSTQLILLRGSPRIVDHLPGVPVQVIGIERLFSVRAIVTAIRLARQLKRSGVSIAHLYFNDTSILLPPVLRAFGLKVVISRRDLGFWYTRGKLVALRLNRLFVNRVVANSRAVADAVGAREGYPPSRIAVIYNALLRQIDGAPTAGVHRAGEDKVIGLIANLRPLKRIDVAVRALAALRAAGVRARLVVVGDDGAGCSGTSHRQELTALAAQLGVADRVEFTGLVAQPEPLLASFDACVLCSESEGFSNSVMEYLAAGKPTVCTDVGGAGEVIDHGTNGLLVPVGDHASLAAALQRVFTDEEFARRLSTAARETVRERFARHAMTQRHCELYANLCPGFAAPRSVRP